MKVPILRHGQILLTSFQDNLTDRDGINLQEDLLEMIQKVGAEAVLMDLSAMEVIDSYQAKVVSDTAAMSRLLGCEVVLSGVQPKVAVALVELGDVLAGVRTVLNLEHGLALLQDAGSSPGEDPEADEALEEDHADDPEVDISDYEPYDWGPEELEEDAEPVA